MSFDDYLDDFYGVRLARELRVLDRLEREGVDLK